jgi:arsenite methyltransferase
MDKALLNILADPVSGATLELGSEVLNGDADVVTGELRSADGHSYSITDGIPRFVEIEDRGQRQTAETFGYKWGQRDSYDSPGFREFALGWFLERYGFQSEDELRAFFRNHRLTLDAGCGSGFSSSLWMSPGWSEGSDAEWVGLDISVAIDVAQERLGTVGGAHFVQGDVARPPFRPQTFDAILSEGVLHHTPSTKAALSALAKALAPGGEVLFYVYRKKGPIREFADDSIREALSGLSPEQAWDALRPLTALAQSLAELEANVEVPNDIPYLGIEAGTYDVQRLVYWHFLKLFWNPELGFEENNHVNFDWYHPEYAHRQTEEEVRAWCEELGLEIFHLNAQESGFTVRATKA